MAPELFEGKAATPAVDVYALGLVLHRSLTRNPSFRAPERSPGSRRVFIPEIPDIRRLCPGVGNRLADGIRSALQRDPLSRPANGSAMLQRLLEPGSTFEVRESSRPAAASSAPQDLPFTPLRRPSLPPTDLPPESRAAAFRSIPPQPAPEAAPALPPPATPEASEEPTEPSTAPPAAEPGFPALKAPIAPTSLVEPKAAPAPELPFGPPPAPSAADEDTVFVDPFAGGLPTGEESTWVDRDEPGFPPDLSSPTATSAAPPETAPVEEPRPAVAGPATPPADPAAEEPTVPDSTATLPLTPALAAPPEAPAPSAVAAPTAAPPEAIAPPPSPESTATLPLRSSPAEAAPKPSTPARSEKAPEKSGKTKTDSKPEAKAARPAPKAAPAAPGGSMNLVFLGGSLGFAAVVLCAGAWIVTRPKPPPIEPPQPVVELPPPPAPAPAPAPAPEPPPERVLTPVLPPEAFLPPTPSMQASPLPANPRPAPAPAPGAKPPPPAAAPAPAPAAANPWGAPTNEVTVNLGVKKGATGVMIALDGWDVGEAPYKATLQPGKHLIRWHKDGLIDLSCDISIPNRNVSYNVDPAKPTCP